MKDQEQLKSLNQLLSLVIGGRIARQTEHLKSAPINRINHAQKIIADGNFKKQRATCKMVTMAHQKDFHKLNARLIL